MIEDKSIGKVVHAVMVLGYKRATKYVSPTLIVRATSRLKPRRNKRTHEMVLTIGKPNWHERQYIANFMKTNNGCVPYELVVKNWKSK